MTVPIHSHDHQSDDDDLLRGLVADIVPDTIAELLDLADVVDALFEHRDDDWPIHYVNDYLLRPESLCGITDFEPAIRFSGSGKHMSGGNAPAKVCEVCARLRALRDQLDLTDFGDHITEFGGPS